MPMQPSPISETTSPCLPKARCFMVAETMGPAPHRRKWGSIGAFHAYFAAHVERPGASAYAIGSWREVRLAEQRMTPVNEGEILAGKYRVERVLGVGGMGVVVAALHIALDERVAIKFLLPEALTNAEAVARFAREARAAVKIKSQHVARVIDVGTLETGAPYMVMEFLKGQDLSNHLRSNGALPIADAVDYVLQACEALAEAHALGIVHRDLKPANLFLTT